MTLIGVGLLLFVLGGYHTAYFPQIFLAVLLIGFGAATAFTPLLSIALASVPSKDAGIGSGIVNVSQQVAGVLSVAVLGAVSSNRTASLLASGDSSVSALYGGYHVSFRVALASVVVAIIVAFLLLKRGREMPEASAARGDTFDAEAETLIVEIM